MRRAMHALIVHHLTYVVDIFLFKLLDQIIYTLIEKGSHARAMHALIVHHLTYALIENVPNQPAPSIE